VRRRNSGLLLRQPRASSGRPRVAPILAQAQRTSVGTMKCHDGRAIIVANPAVMNGAPCFRGTRVPFKNLIDYLEGGHSLREFLNQFRSVTREMAVQALEEVHSLLDRIA